MVVVLLALMGLEMVVGLEVFSSALAVSVLLVVVVTPEKVVVLLVVLVFVGMVVAVISCVEVDRVDVFVVADEVGLLVVVALVVVNAVPVVVDAVVTITSGVDTVVVVVTIKKFKDLISLEDGPWSGHLHPWI